MADEGWEERMAARARERWVPSRVAAEVEAARQMRDWWREGALYIERTQTLGDALEYLAWEHPGCACAGPPCCVQRYENARRLKRAAHIAVKLVQDYAKVSTNG